VSDLAPADLLIQRAGRLRRHPRDGQGERVEGPDQRGPAIFHIFSPPPSPEAPANWFSSFLSGAAVIYPDHGKLWVGASWLATRQVLRIPEDLPVLVEAVYSPDSDLRPPESLTPRSDRAEGKARADRSIADNNRLAFHRGYGPDGSMSDWRDEVSTPTRLGDPTVTLRLCREVEGRPQPMHPGEHGWELSEVSIRQASVAAEAEEDAAFAERARAEMPGHGQWKILVLVRPQGDGFTGRARGPGGDPVEIVYSHRLGLETIR
jgi:CRISPR-associated endonuclease/helicase Cas3